MNGIWVSLSAYGGVTTREALAVLWAVGVRQVELAIGVKPSPDTVEVLRQYGQQGMRYRAHHAIVWQEQRSFNLADSFDARYFERLTDWLAAMDIIAYSVHAGSYHSSDDPAVAYTRFLDHVNQLSQLCRDRGIRLGVETMYPALSEDTSQYLLQNTAQVGQLLHDLPDIDLVVDMAHLNIWRTATISQKLQVLQIAQNRILEIHISDNDGYRDSHTAVSDRTWWLDYAAMFPPSVAIVLESRMNRQSVEQVKQLVETTQALIRRTYP
ncbi:MAG: TIM barrel protein [Leptolyngbyaceae cyanobacterium bins.302]|nr:TIM barrel protein [Leptolyngbyaceae cyanobacterium bins.302]